MFTGTSIMQNVLIPDYKEPSRPTPFSVISFLSAGPIEKVLSLGIPFYTLGNHSTVVAGEL